MLNPRPLALLLLLTACSANTTGERDDHVALPLYDSAAAHVQNGVALFSRGSLTCSGSLVAPNVVLTAAHCVEPELFAFVESGAYREVRLGTAHPDFDPATGEHDIAVLLLSEPVSEVAPVSVGPAEKLQVGDPLWVLGYGTGDDFGSQRIGRVAISDLAPALITTVPDPSRPCRGDSGGPAFGPKGQLVAVVSRGDTACESYAKLARLDDSALSFIRGFVDEYREHTRQGGEPCKLDSQCAAGSCVAPGDAPSHAYCATPCTHATDCPSDMRCTAGQCLWPTPSPGAEGAVCASNAECESGVCAGYPRACRARCLPEQSACGPAQECRRLDDSVWGACLDTADLTGSCSLGPSSPTPGALFVLAFLAVVIRRGAPRSAFGTRRKAKARLPD
ncbi:MAG: S1 family peptidase [Myxococcales bacterium]|nr:S1 family peptidase [Myxococcales bacterium]MCB9582860.1 S1 family peptidase [Polyangiaceae bacterium]